MRRRDSTDRRSETRTNPSAEAMERGITRGIATGRLRSLSFYRALARSHHTRMLEHQELASKAMAEMAVATSRLGASPSPTPSVRRKILEASRDAEERYRRHVRMAHKHSVSLNVISAAHSTHDRGPWWDLRARHVD